MTRWPVQRFNFATEVLPVVLIGTLLDIIGRYGCGYLQTIHGWEVFSFLFLDMIGTAFSAIIIGPWWGALVGIFSALINGNFHDNYFPFGVVNVCGGLAWGYVSFAIGVREKLAEENFDARTALYCFVALILSGALACGLASFAVQAVLYPPMERSFVRGAWYIATQNWLKIYLPRASSDVWTLFWGALSREFLDKTITLGLAFACVIFFSVPRRKFSSLPTERIKTDVVSLLCFIAVYALYLCFARIFRPEILFNGGTTHVEWLTYPTIISLLYFPLLLAIVSFLFGTLNQNTSYGRRVEAYRFRRRATFARLLSNRPWQFLQDEISQQAAIGKKIYGLAAGVAAWPITKAGGLLTKASGLLATDVGLAYVGAVTAAICYYFYQNYQLVEATRKFNAGTQGLLDWLSIGSTAADAGAAAGLFAEQLGDTCSRKYWNASLVYLVLETTRTSAASRLSPATSPSSVLVALSVDPCGLTPEARAVVRKAIQQFPSQSVFLLHPNARDPGLVLWSAEFWKAKVEFFLVDWTTAQECLETLGRKERITHYLAKLRVDARGGIIGGSTKDESGPVTYKNLAERALPNLVHIMDRMSKGQSVLDLGAGRGRHTLYALQSGLKAISIERKQEAYSDLVAAIDAASGTGSATVVLGDYTEVDIPPLGRSDLVISTGVLQHVKTRTELKTHLAIMRAAASRDFGNIYIEMLFDMLFDGKRPDDGRLDITPQQFEQELQEIFPEGQWKIARVFGPVRKLQTFGHRPRSFYPPAEKIEVTVIEYFLLNAG